MNLKLSTREEVPQLNQFFNVYVEDDDHDRENL